MMEAASGKILINPETMQPETGYGKGRPMFYPDQPQWNTELYNAEHNPNAFNPGYEPSYWENPRNVAIAYHKINEAGGEELYPWMDKAAIKDAYDYFKLANGDLSDQSWKYLAPNDPARGYLQSIGSPPAEYKFNPKQYQALLFLDLYTNPVNRTPDNLSLLNPSYRWYLDNEEYTKQLLDTYQKLQPHWMTTMGGLMSDPAFTSIAPMSAFGLITGGIPGLLGMTVIGGGTYLASQIENPIISSAVGTALTAGTMGHGRWS